MGIVHASAVMLVGYILTVFFISVIYITTGMPVMLCILFVPTCYPILGLWVDTVDKAYKS